MTCATQTPIDRDIVILGGGIAGLWVLNRLRDAGYDAVLLESSRLGGGQTIASQGMIHGGIKYSLSGALTSASNALAGMPAHWRACLEGHGDVDLRGTRLLSRDYYMWPRHSFRSRLNAFLGSKALHGRVEAIAPPDYPAFFQGRIPGPLYRLDDIVLDVSSLLHTLSLRHRKHIHRIDWEEARLLGHAHGGIDCLALDARGTRLRGRRYVITAGVGMEMLQQRFGLEATPMQRRPLQMVMVRHHIPDPIYVHCVADQLTATPELTVTTHPCRHGGHVWYLGGELAESGAGLSQGEQIERARAKVRELFPWCRLDDAQWASFYIDRAEPRQEGGHRPDKAFVKPLRNFLVCWPTKLSLTPSLGNEVMAELARQDLHPSGLGAAPLDLPFPEFAEPPWDEHFS